MNYLDIFPDDIIIKILDSRCDAIEKDIYILFYKLSCIENSVEGLSIEKKSYLQLQEEIAEYARNNEEYEGGFNDRYNILK